MGNTGLYPDLAGWAQEDLEQSSRPTEPPTDVVDYVQRS